MGCPFAPSGVYRELIDGARIADVSEPVLRAVGIAFTCCLHSDYS